MRVLYFDCFSGISGDMFLAALVGLGVPEEIIQSGIRSLGLKGLELEFGSTIKNGIEAKTFRATVFKEDADTYGFTESSMKHLHKEEHNHGQEYGHCHSHEEGHEHGHIHEHSHESDHEHNHDHKHEHENSHELNHNHDHSHEHGHSHDHEHDHDHDHHGRTFAHIKTMIEKSSISEKSKKISIDIFQLIAEAEGKIHGAKPEEVHFHEVGAYDSIADIVGAAIGIDWLNPEKIMFSKLPLTQGFVKCNHGIMPLPAPATAEILRDIPTIWEEYRFEMVTPTGAAIAKALSDEFNLPPRGEIKRTGYGAGKKTYERPNVIRGMLIETEENGTEASVEISAGISCSASDKTPLKVLELEMNVDDMTGEGMGYVLQKSLEQGALDAWATPIYMKKNRPAYKLSFLIKPVELKKFTEFLLKHTTSFGLRISEKNREILDRSFKKIELPDGVVHLKIGKLGGDIIHVTPEFEDCKHIAESTGKTIEEVMRNALEKYKEEP